MIIRCILILSFSFVIVMAGCTTTDVYQTGQSSIVEIEWEPEIHLNKTTEIELVDLLGEPNCYCHKVGAGGKEKYMLYVHQTTECKRYNLIFVPNAQFASEQKESVKRVWFYVSDGVVTEILQSGKKPDLRNYLRSDGSGYPYSDKCKIKSEEGDAS